MTLNDESRAMVRAPNDEAFGKYTLIAKIGHGGMAEVFLAANRGPAGFTKLTVLKRLHPHLEEEEGLVGMFLDEARLAARLNHPHVVQTYEISHAEGLHYLAMEYLEGQSLARVLRHARKVDEPLPLSVGVKLFIDVLDGLHYAHSLRDFDGSPLNVVHRDISPGNLFITYEGQVKILDFGIAKAGTQLNETRAGQVKGKFAYIAPEQAAPGAHDHRADLWSLGVVMWEAFAGRRLFKGDSEVLTLHNTLTSQILSLDETGIPAPLAAIVDRSLQRDPMARYQSAREMKEDLENYMHEAGLRASRSDIGAMVIGLFERERDEQRRVLKAYMAGELKGEALAPVHTSTGSHSGVINREQSLLPPVQSGEFQEPRRSGRWIILLILLFSAVLGGLLAALFSGDVRNGDTVAAGDPLDPQPMDFGDEADEAPDSPDSREAEEGGDAPETEDAVPEDDTVDAEEGESEQETPPSEAAQDTTVAMRPRRRRPRPARMTQMSEMTVETPAETASAPAAETGLLTLDTVPWSQVSLNGESLGTTPILRHRLPAGAHTLLLVNPERGLRQRYRVTIRPGETTRRRVGLD
ncbi:MAG: protein kinase [Polyangiales bacterium]